MPHLELRQDRFRVVFQVGGKRFRRALKTRDRRAANLALARLDDNLRRVEQGLLTIPPDADVVTFLLSDGRTTSVPTLPEHVTLQSLFDAYFAALPEGNLEPSTISGMRIHERQLVAHFGASLPISTLTVTHLQRYIEQRSKAKGRRGRPVTPVTIRKAIVTLRTVWNWGLQHDLVAKRFPTKGLKYPKAREKPPFETFSEVAERVQGLPPAEAADLWECAFLTVSDIDELLRHVKTAARHPFLYPMFVFAAHTGARRSEILRSRLADIDWRTDTITIHERKKSHEKRTTRRVPMTPLLRSVLIDWRSIHPGGEITFVHLRREPKRGQAESPFAALTVHEAMHHFRQVLLASKWQFLPGWHVFRHSFCSNCAAQGIDQRIINQWVGHQTPEMVRRYQHLLPNQQREAIRSVFG